MRNILRKPAQPAKYAYLMVCAKLPTRTVTVWELLRYCPNPFFRRGGPGAQPLFFFFDRQDNKFKSF